MHPLDPVAAQAGNAIKSHPESAAHLSNETFIPEDDLGGTPG